MPKVKVDDVEINYEIHGEGFPLIMINGYSANLDSWSKSMIDELSKKFKVVLFDNRGVGRSTISDKEFSIELFAHDVSGLMDALGIRKAHVHGISMGGMIAQEFAINFPERVEKLILTSTWRGGKFWSDQIARIMAGDPDAFDPEVPSPLRIMYTDEFIENNSETVNSIMESVLTTSPEITARQMAAIEKYDSYDRLPKIKAPTLVMNGKMDVFVKPEYGKILASAIPNAKFVILEKSAHGLYEEVDKVNRLFIDFLTKP